MIKMEKITYLVTNYNNGKYVDDCLNSISAQKNQNWECLIVDDMSTDDSVNRIKKYVGDKVKLIINNQNIGQIHSIIKMLDGVQTDIVCIVDSDDAIHADTTDEVIKAFDSSDRIGFVYTNCIEYDNFLMKPISVGLSQRIPFGPTSSIINGHVSSLRCFRRSAYTKTDGYDSSLLYAEDLDLGYKLEEVCLPYFINKFLYKYRYVENSRGRLLERKIAGYHNRAKAKNNALERRELRGRLYLLCKLYIYSEMCKCIYSKQKKKVRKFILERVMSFLKKIINRYAFRSIIR